MQIIKLKMEVLMTKEKLQVQSYLQNLENQIIEMFKGEGTGHDIGHLHRVTNLALKIAEAEKGASVVVVAISAFLHDLHRIMQTEKGKTVHPKQSITLAKRLLKNTDLSKEMVDEICYCIEHHENYNWNGNNVTNINALIVQDADNLDMLGAIGVGRTFTYGGANGMLMYDPSVPLNTNNDYTEFGGNDPSTIHHFYHKMFKLGDNMNTKTAKKLAKSRTKFLHTFASEFLNEWNGKK